MTLVVIIFLMGWKQTLAPSMSLRGGVTGRGQASPGLISCRLSEVFSMQRRTVREPMTLERLHENQPTGG